MPEPTVEVSQYTVSLLPRGHIDYRAFLVTVDRVLTPEGQIQWAVNWCGYQLGHDGAWSPGPIRDRAEWVSTHRWLDREDALAEAREAVRRIEVNGIPVGAALARLGAS
jgi:hypothetical protein